MAHPSAHLTTTTTATTPAGLRSLYLIRVAFSVVWVVLVVATSRSLRSPDEPSAVAAFLLVVYPLWDGVATILERRMAGPGETDRMSAANVALSFASSAIMVAAVLATIGKALLVFGIWASLTGAIQLVTAVRRRTTVGAQWPMMISGGLSVIAGVSFAAMSASASGRLTSIAGYSAVGAIWFLVSSIVLRTRSAPGRASAA